MLTAENRQLLQIENLIYPKTGIFVTWKKFPEKNHLGKNFEQRAYGQNQRGYILDSIKGHIDLYVSQCNYSDLNRQSCNFKSATHAWVDLDYYKLDCFKALSVDQIHRQLEKHIIDNNVPVPSEIIYSGNGMYLKWFFTNPIDKKDGERLKALNKKLNAFFHDFNVDTQVFDLARVLRGLETINSKTGNPVEKIADTNTYYDFDTLCSDLAVIEDLDEPKETKSKAKPKKGNKKPKKQASQPSKAKNGVVVHSLKQERTQRHYNGLTGFSKKSWCWNVFCDIETLIKLRYSDEKIPRDTDRDKFTFVGSCQLAYLYADDPVTSVKDEIYFWAAKYVDADFLNDEFLQYAVSLLQRVARHRNGEKVEFQGKLYSPIYLFKKQSLIDYFGITSEEMKFLNVLIDDKEKQSRRYEQTREEYLVSVSRYSDKQLKIWEYFNKSERTYKRHKADGKITQEEIDKARQVLKSRQKCC